jgi:hypothetical protein
MNPKPKKPRLTARIARGLGAVYALADVNQFDDSDLYAGCRGNEKAMAEIDAAVAWLGNLINWYDRTHPKEE